LSGTQVSSTNKTDHHDITKILLKVALSTITSLPPLNSVRLQIEGTFYFNSNYNVAKYSKYKIKFNIQLKVIVNGNTYVPPFLSQKDQLLIQKQSVSDKNDQFYWWRKLEFLTNFIT
jgi:hypothetical protein